MHGVHVSSVPNIWGMGVRPHFIPSQLCTYVINSRHRPITASAIMFCNEMRVYISVCNIASYIHLNIGFKLVAIQFVSIRGDIGMLWCTHTFVQPSSLRSDNLLNQACSSHTTRLRDYFLGTVIVKNAKDEMMPSAWSWFKSASA